MKNVGSLISEILTWLTNMGYAGIAIGLMIEIIPSEIVLAYGGYMVSEGTIGFIGAIIAGVIGAFIAQIFIYWIGRYGGRPFLDKYGKYLLIKKHHIDMSENWFQKYLRRSCLLGSFYTGCQTCHIHSGRYCQNAFSQICGTDCACYHSMVYSVCLFRHTARKPVG